MQSHSAASRSELAYRSRLTRQQVAFEAQPPQRREQPDLRWHSRQLIVVELQPLQRREMPDLRRHARQLIFGEVSCPISVGKLVSWLPVRYNFVIAVSCPISAGRLVS